MIKNISYSVTFPTTGRKFSQTVDFTKGLTGIVGPNEAGKSLILEMIRFNLFGSKALRGTGPDYKTLKSEMTFVVKGVEYTVKRSIKDALLSSGVEDIAVGTTPVNAKIIDILGFGIEVFDIACAANQSQIEALSDMKPTERRRLVDNVIGIGTIDSLIKWAGDEANIERRTIEALELTLVKPEAPQKPEGYQPSVEIAPLLQKESEKRDRYFELKGLLENKPVPPEKPVPVEGDLDELEAYEQKRREDLAERRVLEKTAAGETYEGVDLDKVVLQHKDYDAYKDHQAFLRDNPKPQYDRLYLASSKDRHKHNQQVDEYNRMKAQLDKLEKDQVVCPKCSHGFPLAAAQVEDLKARMEGMPSEKVEADLDLETIDRQLKRWDFWDGRTDKEVPEVEAPEISLGQIDTIKNVRGAQEKLKQMGEPLPSKEDQLQAVRDYKQLDKQYNGLFTAYQEQMKLYETRLGEFNKLNFDAEALKALQSKMDMAKEYELLQKSYETQLEKYTNDKLKIEEHQQKVDQWDAARVGLRELKSRVKAYLVPSLNRVASHLLGQMTNFSRSVVEVDEDFNIMIDGQELKTLSGSGKAVSNLAIRIGLGQVLTNNVFSVFLGDELDGSMDQERAQATADCLENLTNHISQILLVTHKDVEFENVIALS